MVPLDGVTTEVPSKEVTSPWDVGSGIQGTTVPRTRHTGPQGGNKGEGGREARVESGGKGPR